jgi:phosphatidylinositol alpha-1,6-mannosyltransferase
MASQSDLRPWAMLVTRNFPPLLGGMERLNKHLLGGLAEHWRMAMCGPAGSSRFAEAAEEVRETEVSPLSSFLIKSMWRTWRMASHRRPQWIVAGSGLTAPMAWLAARRNHAKAAVYLHGLDVIAPSVIYRSLWLPFIRRCDVVLVNSRATMGLAIAIGVPRDRITVINPGTDIPVLNSQRAKQFRVAHGLGSSPLMLSVGRLTRRKGLAEFVVRTFPSIIAAHPDAVLLVIGGEAKDALHGGGEGERERILRIAGEACVEGNIRFLGRCDEDDLHAAYEASDVHVFPVLDLPDDVEGFGMVALEAAAHGLPSVAFDVGGISDAVKPGVTGALVTSGAYDEFAAEVLRYLDHVERRADMADDCRAFATTKAWPVFTRSVLAALGQRGRGGHV